MPDSKVHSAMLYGPPSADPELHKKFFRQASMPSRADILLDRVEKLISMLEPQSSILVTGREAIDAYNSLARVKDTP